MMIRLLELRSVGQKTIEHQNLVSFDEPKGNLLPKLISPEAL
jgi:hypothetical protein